MLYLYREVKKVKLSDQIKEIRKTKKITQKEQAKKIGVSEITIRKFEAGSLKLSLENIIKIFESLNVNYSIYSNKIGFQNANFNKSPDVNGYFYDYDNDNVEIKNVEEEQQKILNNLVYDITTPKIINGIPIRELVIENKEKTLLSNFNSVNEDGQKKIVDYSSDIADNPKYKKDK